jgi:hypothetical protein
MTRRLPGRRRFGAGLAFAALLSPLFPSPDRARRLSARCRSTVTRYCNISLGREFHDCAGRASNTKDESGLFERRSVPVQPSVALALRGGGRRRPDRSHASASATATGTDPRRPPQGGALWATMRRGRTVMLGGVRPVPDGMRGRRGGLHRLNLRRQHGQLARNASALRRSCSSRT